MVREAAMCRDCVKTQNKIEREKIDLLKRALFNYFNTGNGFPTHDFLENDRNFLFLHSLCRILPITICFAKAEHTQGIGKYCYDPHL